MKVSYAWKAVAWQFVTIGVVIASATAIDRPVWAAVASATTGLIFAWRARLPEGLGRRFFPPLALPILLCLCWGAALNFTQGDYSGEGGWGIVRFLAYPGWWGAERVVWFGLSVAEFLPESIILPFYSWLDEVWLGLNYEVHHKVFVDGFGLYYALTLHFLYLAGFAGPALLRAPGRRFDHPAAALLIVCLASGGYLDWELDRRERLLVPGREQLSEEKLRGIMGEEEGYSEYDPHYAFQPWSKIARPDAPPSLRITSNPPRLDGATAFLPVLAAVFQAVYETPAHVPHENGEAYLDNERTGFISRHLQLNTSREAYGRLIQGKTDLLVVFGPSEAQAAEAKAAGVPLELTPIGKEAFVFFVHADNPVNGLNVAEIRKIYSGKIDNWKDVGGADAPILAYQRPENSGSRTAMEQMVMRGLPQARAPLEEMILPMEGVVTAVAGYRNETPALGYSFRWFVMAMFSRPELKLLNVDGVAPRAEHIADGTYPLIRTFYAVTRQNDASPETKKLVEWMAGPEGQALIAKTGYVPMR